MRAIDDVISETSRWSVVHGDCREVLRDLPAGLDFVTDPPWPNAPAGMFDCDPWQVWSDFCALPSVATARRLAVYIGRTSDPRFLSCVPSALPFVCACWMRRVPPVYLGSVLGEADLCYVFGEPRAGTGYRVIGGGDVAVSRPDGRLERAAVSHPCFRDLRHMLWIVKSTTMVESVVVDPFAGTSSTGVACLRLGRRYIGIESIEQWANESRERLEAEESNSTMAARAAGQESLFRGQSRPR